MLFRRADLEAIAAGAVTLAFRRWRRGTVRAGGSLRTALGVLAIEAVDQVVAEGITETEATAAGYSDRAALLAALAAGPEGHLYRIRLRYIGGDPRCALARSEPDAADICNIVAVLDRLDRRGAWTRAVLRQIASAPGRRAADLAAAAGMEIAAYKRRVRALKEIGLTESLDVGYRLSPRGSAVADALGLPVTR